jgi:hypothetical protein
MVGVARNIYNRSKAATPRYGAYGLWNADIVGALGEQVVAKATDRYWSGTVGTRDYDGDVGPWHVRASEPHTNRLLVHDSDPDDGLFVFVTGRAPCLAVRGWILGADAKAACHWDDGLPDPAYAVPADALAPWETRPHD